MKIKVTSTYVDCKDCFTSYGRFAMTKGLYQVVDGGRQGHPPSTHHPEIAVIAMEEE